MSIQVQAEDFFNAYQVLKDNNEAFLERQAISSGKSPVVTKIEGAHYTGGVEIVCLAFSAELYIKDLYSAVKVIAPRSHKILDLFEGLPKQIKQEIFAYDSISQNPFFTRGDNLFAESFSNDFSAYDGFIDHIKAISDGFEKWRYSYESASLHYDISFALAFIESIKSAVEEVRKHT